jgi:hypothetical protein
MVHCPDKVHQGAPADAKKRRGWAKPFGEKNIGISYVEK